jgi:hypothetical protein
LKKCFYGKILPIGDEGNRAMGVYAENATTPMTVSL